MAQRIKLDLFNRFTNARASSHACFHIHVFQNVVQEICDKRLDIIWKHLFSRAGSWCGNRLRCVQKCVVHTEISSRHHWSFYLPHPPLYTVVSILTTLFAQKLALCACIVVVIIEVWLRFRNWCLVHACTFLLGKFLVVHGRHERWSAANWTVVERGYEMGKSEFYEDSIDWHLYTVGDQYKAIL